MKRPQTKTAQELSEFCSQLCAMLRSGMLLGDGLTLLSEETPGDEGLRRAAEANSAGAPLSDALRQAGVFPAEMLSLLALGEQTGRLETVLCSLARFYEREQNLRRQLRSTLLYPLMLSIMMCFVIGVLLLKVLPVFSEVIRLLGADAGLSEQALCAGRTVGWVALGATGACVLAALCVLLCCRTSKGYERLSARLAHLPLFRRVGEELSAGRFAFSLSLLLSSGCGVGGMLDTLGPAAGKKAALCRAAMERGATFCGALEEAKVFSPFYCRMLRLGERSGTLDEAANRVASLYDEQIEQLLSGILGMIEPAVALLLSLVVSAVLLCAMLPLLNLMTAMG